ncbi:hypothetical protein [Shewanella sp. YLB-07]|uniref:hypothetical protein n=1 Tax=Shewanella sp. YLB-07 TaxID=2601268 RepID=UPI00128D0597|nr:hypothetical protein [Shewanella sp. YLB-07]MPY24475.1 hypothetical protein [Shewanella sp. YLB-07]
MSMKLVALLLLVMSGNVMASQTYDLTATVKHNNKILTSPKLKLVEGHWEQTKNDSCTYSSRVTAQPDHTLFVENEIFCGDAFFQPSFTLYPEGGEAALEVGVPDNLWNFAVSLLVQD